MCRRFTMLAFAIVLVGNAAGTQAATVYRFVNAAKTTAGTGLSWATAYQSLQSALTYATTTSNTVEIWVCQGEYFPSQRETSTDPYSMTFKVGSNVKLYGGFNGLETSVDERDPATYTTTLNGKISSGGGSYSCYHVVTFEGATWSTVLNGFTITNGYASDYGHTGTYSTYGGGVLVRSGNPSISQCVFKSNTAAQSGGAIALPNGGSPMITRCLFLGNKAETSFGGAVYLYGQPSSPYLISCAFSGNSCPGGNGGGLATTTSARVINCTFSNNSAGAYGGGVFAMYSSSSSTISNCIMWANTAGSGSTEQEQIRLYNSATATVGYSCIQGWSGSLGGLGNIGTDPKLRNPLGADGVAGTGDDNLHLTGISAPSGVLGSPSINAGSNSLFPSGAGSADLDGSSRIVSSVIDQGAYECGSLLQASYP